MTLEDFFTLTEMTDGLTAPVRVKELVNVMQQEKDCIVKNVGDATRQWSTVASTIAATEDKDCLDLFVHLDGLWFIDRWLKDAQKFGNDTSESFVEESVTALLNALEKLHIDYKKSISCGIWMTVKDLLGHSSARVQDRARAVFDSWTQDGDNETVPQDVERVGASHTDGLKGSGDLAGEGVQTECSAKDIALSRESADEEKHVEPASDEMMQSICSEAAFQAEKDDGIENQTSNKEKNHEVLKDECSTDPVGSSIMLKPEHEIIAVTEESPLCHSEGTASIETCASMVPKQGIELKSDVPQSSEFTDEAKKIQNVTSPLDKFGEMETSVSILGDDDANAQESVVTDWDLQNNVDAEGKGVSPNCDMRTDMSEGKSRKDDAGSPLHCRSMTVFQNEGRDCDTDGLLNSAANDVKAQKLEDPDSSLSSEDSGAVDKTKGHSSDESEDLTHDSDFFKPRMDVRGPDVVEKSTPDLELDYCMVDALEVARQVAIEVEREVVDRREPSCSSSEKISNGGSGQPDSPECVYGKEIQESVYGKEIQPFEAATNEVPGGPNQSAEASPNGEELLSSAKTELLSSAKTLDTEAENHPQDMGSSLITEAAQEPQGNSEKGLSDFDLNQEVCCEDMERPVNPISTPISVVSASRAAAAPGFPASPLQFEGAHGWKGSAATSAFRRASPRRILEDDKTLTTEGSQNSSKQRHDWLDFDLNVAEAGDDKVADLTLGKPSSGIPFGESSVEASPRRSERLNLDLNRISDDGDAPSDWKMDGRIFHHRNGHRSPSPSSSSSSMQPALRNIDLNDQPSFYNDSSDLQPYLGKSSSQNLNASGFLKSDDSVISIMGTRVEVNRKDFVPRIPSLPNWRTVENLDFSLARSGGVLAIGSALPYTHPSGFGYNGLTVGPAVSFPSAAYGPGGPIPCMVDSRAPPVVPQVLGSASASPAPYSQPPFIMSMIETHPGSNGAGPSRPNFDLNSGFIFEGGNRESGALRQLFNPGLSRSIDEQLRANSQPSSGSGGVGKRKEPDGGWDYPFNYKHHQPPWK